MRGKNRLVAYMGLVMGPVLFFSPSSYCGELNCARSNLAAQTLDISKIVVGNVWNAKCELSPKAGQNSLSSGLSPFWAQQIIGADMAKQFLGDAEAGGRKLAVPVVADIDLGWVGQTMVPLTLPVPKELYGNAGSHAVQVANLIGGNGEFGVGYNTKVMPVTYDRERNDEIAGLDAAGKEVQNSNSRIVNLEIHTLCTLNTGDCTSAYFGQDNFTLTKLISDLSHDKILVAAAGNMYPAGSVYNSNSILNKTILVGSSTPAGLISGFSDESPDVAILAPSDMTLFSPSGKGNNLFGGTSGATPLVSGALANVEALTPGLSAAEAKALLQSTATPMPATKMTNRNGVGMLNAYKLIRVSGRLAEGWPSNRERILNDKSLFDFSAEAKGQLDQAKSILGKAGTDCAQFRSAMNLLRKSFLLDPKRETSDLLALMYSGSDSPKDSRFYAIRTVHDLEILALNKSIDVNNDDDNGYGPANYAKPSNLLRTYDPYETQANARLRRQIEDQSLLVKTNGAKMMRSQVGSLTEFRIDNNDYLQGGYNPYVSFGMRMDH